MVKRIKQMKILRKISRTLLSEAKRSLFDYNTSAVIVAAGKSTRTSGDIPKQFVEINGIPVIVHTAQAFDRCPQINEIIIVVADDRIDMCKDLFSAYEFSKPVKITIGGESRDISAKKGFEATSKDAEFIAFHDGARCLIKPEDVSRVVKAAYGCGAAIAVARSTDTLKRVDDSGNIKETLDRERIFRAQTPQVFMREIYEISAYSPRKFGSKVTDESMLAEEKKIKVKAVEVGAYNIKITTDEDFYFARRIIEGGDEK